MPARPANLTGQRFGKLVAVRTTGERSNNGYLWDCLCDCGGTTQTSVGNLRSGGALSCGCSRHLKLQVRNKTHGKSDTRAYRAWCSMKERTTNPHNNAYKHYGGRGVRVCRRWRKFENFYEDMGDCPDGLTLDRYPNRNGNYEPGNCRWASWFEQRRNKNNTHFITFQGETMCLTDWAQKIGISHSSLRDRLEAWTLERALTTPKSRTR